MVFNGAHHAAQYCLAVRTGLCRCAKTLRACARCLLRAAMGEGRASNTLCTARQCLRRRRQTMWTWTHTLLIALYLCLRPENTGKNYRSLMWTALTRLSTGRQILCTGQQTVCTRAHRPSTRHHDLRCPRQRLSAGPHDLRRRAQTLRSAPQHGWRCPPARRGPARPGGFRRPLLRPQRPGWRWPDPARCRPAQTTSPPQRCGRPRHHCVGGLQAQ